MQRIFYATASFLAMIAVIIGAFGAHALKERLPIDLLQVFETGVRYQFYHSIALFFAGYCCSVTTNKMPQWAGIFFMIGILFFCGSVYLLAIRDIIGLTSYSWLGPVTPMGGLCFILGWLMLALSFLKKKQ